MNLTPSVPASTWRTLCRLAGAAALGLAPAAHASVTWHDVQFGGFASQGYLINTGKNDYLGETSEGTFDFREYGVNASWASGKLRVGAQVFGQKLAQYGDDDVKLDWAVVDYQATQWFGVRAGRVKMPRGLYNEALDLDSVRPFVLLPQSVYDARLRDFNAAFDGGMIYGNVDLRRFGSVDYRAFYGDTPIKLDSGAADYLNTGLVAPTLSMGMDHLLGGSLFWNTPLSGLKVGYSYSQFSDLVIERLFPLPGRTVPYTKSADGYERHLLSAEYTMGSWVFATELGREEADFRITGFGPASVRPATIEYGYVSASRRINDRLELGTYFSYSQDRQSTNPLLRQADYAISARYDVNQYVLVKFEVHQLNGAGKIFDTVAQPLAKRDQNWTLFTGKVTFTF